MKQKIKQSQIDVFRLGCQALIVLAFLRPILTTFAVKGVLPIHIIVPSVFSYFLLVLLLFVIAQAKPRPDTLGILIITYCIYALYSLAWESDYESLARMTMPFITFFAARSFLDTPKKVRTVLFLLIVGYIIPIVGSSFMIFADASIKEIDYYSEVERQTGLYRGTHTLAHSMSFFSVLFAFFLQNREGIPKLRRYIVYITFVLSVYCIWNSYTRSVYLGFVIFWMFYFFQWRKRYFIIGFSSLLVFVLWKLPTLTNIFLKSSEFSVDGASSGRITLWLHNLKLFSEWPFYYKLLGSGLGTEAESVIGGQYDVWSSHNDWISLLMTTGVIGLLLYGGIIIVLGRDIIRSNLDVQTKALFTSCLIMFISLSSFTNGYVGRFEMSQTFWLFMGCFYCIRAAGMKKDRKMNE